MSLSRGRDGDQKRARDEDRTEAVEMTCGGNMENDETVSHIPTLLGKRGAFPTFPPHNNDIYTY